MRTSQPRGRLADPGFASQFAFFLPHPKKCQSCRPGAKSRRCRNTGLLNRTEGTAPSSSSGPQTWVGWGGEHPGDTAARTHVPCACQPSELREPCRRADTGHQKKRLQHIQSPWSAPDNHLDRTCGDRAAQVLHLSQDLK